MPAGRSLQFLQTIILMALHDTSCALLVSQPRLSSGLNRSFYIGEDTHTRRRRRLSQLLSFPTSSARACRFTSLCMTQNPRSNNGDKFDEDDDRKKKNKGEQKIPSDSKGANETSNVSKAKRPFRRRDNQKSSGKQQPERNKRGTMIARNKENADKSKSKARSCSLKTKSGSRINTSDENTSLKGFKEPKQQQVAPQRQESIEPQKEPTNDTSSQDTEGDDGKQLKKRMKQLESLLSTQMSEIQKLRREVDELTKAVSLFANVVEILRDAGLQVNDKDSTSSIQEEFDTLEVKKSQQRQTGSFLQPRVSPLDDMPNIFGIAPTSVTDAADAAGAAILSAILAGKQRMLVDVRDAELTSDPQLFVEFIELAILPVAAGLEGLDADMRNRVKIVFPTVKDLMTYRKSMALAAPEVVALSTLGFDPVEERDKLIVLVAPSPDDLAGVDSMGKLLARTQPYYVEQDKRITQPVVVVNHHMVPVDMSTFGKFSTVYHLRLLTVQYMTGDAIPEYVAKEWFEQGKRKFSDDKQDGVDVSLLGVGEDLSEDATVAGEAGEYKADTETETDRSDEDDAALEAAMIHAHEIGVHQGVTRAMVIRAYPK